MIIPIFQAQDLARGAGRESAKKPAGAVFEPKLSDLQVHMVSCVSSSFLLLLLQIPLDSPIHLHTNSFRAIIPQVRPVNTNLGV